MSFYWKSKCFDLEVQAAKKITETRVEIYLGLSHNNNFQKKKDTIRFNRGD